MRWLPLALLLVGCASGKLNIAHNELAIPQLAHSCPTSLLADTQPEPRTVPADAGFPAAETPAASLAVSNYLTWLHGYAVWARSGWQRAADAKTFCGAQ